MARLTPDPASLHGRLLAEARTYSPLRIERELSGRPGYVRVVRKCSGETVTVCHVSSVRQQFGHVEDPAGLMSKPDSTD